MFVAEEEDLAVDLADTARDADNDGAVLTTALADEDPPFDPPDEEELAAFIAVPPPGPDDEDDDDAAAVVSPPDPPAPAIVIHASWDRPEAGAALAAFAADPRLARAEIVLARGGMDAAGVAAAEGGVDLFIVDSTLTAPLLLAGLDRLAPALAAGARAIVMGEINDIALLRDLARRGVGDYLTAVPEGEDLAARVCRQYARLDGGRLIAVVGARGGVGASTLARNVAWSIAQRQDASVTLLDLDFPFGGAAAACGVAAPEGCPFDAEDEHAFDALLAAHSERLQIVSPSLAARRFVEPGAEDIALAMRRARRTARYVVADLPHRWAPWVKHALRAADEILLVASPDLASLRNADAIMKEIRGAARAEPVLVLSTAGVPKRPEIRARDFAESVSVTPAISFTFDPDLFDAAEHSQRMLGEHAPNSAAAAAVDLLASMLTGQPVGKKPRREKRETRAAPEPVPAHPAIDGAPQMETSHDAAPGALPPPALFGELVHADDALDLTPSMSAPAAQTEATRDAETVEDLLPPSLFGELPDAEDALDLASSPAAQAGLRRGPHPVRVAALLSALVVLGAYQFRGEGPGDAAAAAQTVASPTLAHQALSVELDAEYARALALLPQDPAGAAALLQQLADMDYAPAQRWLANRRAQP